MASRARPLDWNEIRVFLAVAQARSLAKAARALGVDATTVGRRLASLEARLQAELFTRTPGGYVLTAAGERVLQSARRMEEAAQELPAQAVDDGAPVAGTVRVATTETLAERFVVPAIREVQARHPRVSVAVHTGWPRVDLARGEADLAVRLVRPTDPRLAFRKLADFAFRLYASREYVARGGPPERLTGHPVLAYDDALRLARQPFSRLSTRGLHVAFQTNSARVLIAGAVAGLGIVQLPGFMGDAVPELVPVLPALDRSYSVWLVVPQVKRRVAAVRRVADALVRVFADVDRR